MPIAPDAVTMGSIIAWGMDEKGQLNVPAGDDFIKVEGGGHHGIALKRDGSLVGWGANDKGQSTVPSGSDFVDIVVGGYHNFATRADSTIVGWGNNDYGQATVPPGEEFKEIAGGAYHTIGLRTDGSLVAWGRDEDGRNDLPPGNDFVALGRGLGFQHIAIRTDGTLAAWGLYSSVPATADRYDAAATGLHSVAITDQGELRAWGDCGQGRCDVPDGNHFSAIAATGTYSVALRSDGTLVSWGDDTRNGVSHTPSRANFAAISAGGHWTLARTGAASPLDLTHVYADNGLYEVTVTVEDDDGGIGSDSATVTVNNVDPTLTVVEEQTVDEGDELSITNIGTFTDPGFDNPLNTDPATGGETEEKSTYSIDWGDGTTTDTGDATVDAAGSAGVLTAGSFDGSHIYVDNGVYTATVTVEDDDGGSASDTFIVTVNNIAPTLTVDPVADINENDMAALTGTISDPGTLDTFTLDIDWDDANNSQNSTFTLPPLGDLNVGDTIVSPVDGTVLTVTDVGTTTPAGDPEPVLVDINPMGTSNPVQLTNADGTLFFVATDGVHGKELWTLTGTTVSLVKDIVPGSADGAAFSALEAVGNQVFFMADDGVHGFELWKSDGTAAGTTLVKDINPGAGHALPEHLTNVDGTLYFAAYDGTARQLWKSDGTSLGTVAITSTSLASSSGPGELENIGGTLYFYARGYDSASNYVGYELFKTDGTGTVLVKDIKPGTGSSNVRELTDVNGTAFFAADDGTHGYELWTSDGTSAGTLMVMDINPGTGVSVTGFNSFTNLNGQLLFSAEDGVHGKELWKSDGTAAGTQLVSDINAGGDGFAEFSNGVDGMAILDGYVFFEGADAGSNRELWKSDGTAAGTEKIEIRPGTAGGEPSSITNVDGVLYMSARDNGPDDELWKSDGTAAGTVLVANIRPGSSGSDPRSLTNVEGTLVFTADDGTTGRELWVLDTSPVDAPLVSFRVDHHYADDGSSPGNDTAFDTNVISAGIVDDDLGAGSATTPVTVNNVEPDFEAGGPETIWPDVLGHFARTIDFTDPGLPDVHQVTVNFGDGTGDQTFALPLGDRSFLLDHTFTQGGTFNVNLTVEDDDGGTHSDSFDVEAILAEVQFTAATYSDDEGAGTSTVVTLERSSDTVVSEVEVTIMGGTAQGAGVDYDSSGFPMTVTFTVGVSQMAVPVSIVQEDLVELDETITFEVTAISNATIATQNTAELTVINDDSAVIDIVGESADEATGQLDFTVTITNPVEVAVTVEFDTLATGTATPGVDFTAVADHLVTFAAGTTTPQIVTVPVTDENIVELDETLQVILDNLDSSDRDVTLAGSGSSGGVGAPSGDITVSTTNDESDGDTSSIANLIASPGGSGISLREAVAAANNTVGEDTIFIPAGTYVLSPGVGPGLMLTDSATTTLIGEGLDTIVKSQSDTKFKVTGGGTSAAFENFQVGPSDSRGIEVTGIGTTATLNNMRLTGNNYGSSAGNALYVNGQAAVTVTNSLIDENIGRSGAVTATNAGTIVNLQNVTISGNETWNGNGGGIYVSYAAMVNVMNCTITGNTALGGGINTANGAVLNIGGSIVSGNIGASYFDGDSAEYFISTSSTMNSLGYNIFGVNGTSNGSTYVGGSFALDPTDIVPAAGVMAGDILDTTLADNGGPTRTHALVPGSPTIDAGDPASTATEDQRGFGRPVGVAVDIGAFELGATGGSGDVGVTATGTIINDDTAEISINDVTLAEGDTGITYFDFTVSISNPVDHDLTVQVDTNGVTADGGGVDFADVSQVVTFHLGDPLTQIVRVEVTRELIVEDHETFEVNLTDARFDGVTDAMRATIVDDQGIGTITNDDSATLTITAPSITETDGYQIVQFIAEVDAPVQDGFDVAFLMGPITTEASDLNVLTISPIHFAGTAGGQQRIDVAVLGDEIVEDNEQFVITLGDVTATTAEQDASITTGDEATGTINNDDTATLTIDDWQITEGSGAGTTTLSLAARVDAAVEGGFDVDFSSALGTAESDDFTVVTLSPLEFAGTVGEAHTIDIDITRDAVVEDDETFVITLGNLSATTTEQDASISTGDDATATIINDDTAEVSINNVTIDEGTSGDTTAFVFDVTLAGDVEGGFELDYSTDDNMAEAADGDYQDNDGTLNFAGDDGEMYQVTVLANHDTKVEADELFDLALNSVTSGEPVVDAAIALGGPGVGTIVNDDTAILSVSSVTALEGDTGTQTYVFTVTLSNEVQDGLTVAVDTADGTATTADSDYVGNTGGTIDFAGNIGETQTFPVTVNGDTLVELDEAFSAMLGSLTNIHPTAADDIFLTNGTGTILNDDSAVLSLGNVTQAEGDSGFTTFNLPLTLDNPVDTGMLVMYSVFGGTATTLDADYATTSGNVLIPGYTTDFDLPVLVVGDEKVEFDEDLSVMLTWLLPNGRLVSIADPFGTATIENDDQATLDITDTQVVEGDSGTSRMIFTVALSDSVANPVSVEFQTGDGTATTLDNDYSATSGVLNFAGTAGETQQIVVDVNGDTTIEPDETLTVTLSNILAGGLEGELSTSGSPATGTILNDDNALVSINDVSLAEGNAGTTAMTFSVSIDQAATQDITVVANTSGLTAAGGGTDFNDLIGELVTIPAGLLSATVDVDVTGELLVELDETFEVNLTDAKIGGVSDPVQVSIADGTGIGTIENDDQATVTIENLSQDEGDSGFTSFSFSATLDNPVDADVIVVFDTADGTATLADSDYATTNGAFSFPAGATSTSFNVLVVGDLGVEADDQFAVNINTVAANGRDVVAGSGGTGTIVNDDAIPVADAGGPYTITEGDSLALDASGTIDADGGTHTYRWDVDGDGDFDENIISETPILTWLQLNALGIDDGPDGPITITVETSDGANTDTATTSLDVTNAAPELLVTSVTPTIDENDSATLTVTYRDAGLPDSHEAVISWDDPNDGSDSTFALPGINTLVVGQQFTSSTDGAVATVTAVNGLTGDVTIATSHQYLDDGIAPGNDTSSDTSTISVTVSDDDGGVTAASGSDIQDQSYEGPANVAISFSQGTQLSQTFTVGQSGILSDIDFRLQIPAGPLPGNLSYDVRGASGGVPQFAESPLLASGSIPIADLPPYGGWITVSGLSVPVITGDQLAFTITTDQPSFSLAWQKRDGASAYPAGGAFARNDLSHPWFDQGGDFLFRTWVSSSSADTASIDVNNVPPSFDAGSNESLLPPQLGAFDRTISFTDPGTQDVWSGTVDFGDGTGTFPLVIDQTDQEFTLSHTYTTIGTFAVSVTVEDDDLGTLTDTFDVTVIPPEVQFSANTYNDGEGAGTSSVITLERNTAAGTSTVQVNITGGTASGLTDYGDGAFPMTVTFNPGEQVKTVPLPITPDALVELDETVAFEVVSVSNAAIGVKSAATLNILADDTTAITINDVSQAEPAAGPATMDFAVSISNPVDRDVTVTLNTTAGSATGGGIDYSDLSSITVTFVAGGALTQPVSVPITEETLVEADETFTVDLSDPRFDGAIDLSRAVITDASGLGTIENDDAAVLNLDSVSQAEGDAGSTIFTFTATLTAPVAADLTAGIAVGDGTATLVDGDYSTNAALVFIPAGSLTGTFDVPVGGDVTVELDEDLTVSISSISPGSLGVSAGSDGTGTIENDDNATLSIADAQVTEGDSGTTQLVFDVTLDAPVDVDVSVNYQTQDGTATTTDSDYAATSGALTIATGDTTGQIVVDVNGDTKVELDEALTVALSNLQADGRDVTIGDSSAQGTIINDDSSLVSIVSNDPNAAEPGDDGQFTISLSQPSDAETVVEYTVGGAAGTGDFAVLSGSVTIPADQTSATIDVEVTDDSLVELAETVILTINNVGGALGVSVDPAGDSATVTIADDDSASLSIGDASVVEGDSGTTELVFEVMLNADVDVPIAVDYLTANATATLADGDYVSGVGTLTFAGTVGEAQQIRITVNGDDQVEPDETLQVNLSNLRAAGRDVALADRQGVGTITNDDSASLSISDVTLGEGHAGVSTATFTVTLDAMVASPLLVVYSTADGTAQDAGGDGDYHGQSGTVGFLGLAGEQQTISIEVVGDTKVELDETFFVNLTGVSDGGLGVTISDSQGQATIANDDSATLSIDDMSQVETDGATAFVFTVSLSVDVDTGVSIDYQTSAGTAEDGSGDGDYATTSGTLNFSGTPGRRPSPCRSAAIPRWNPTRHSPSTCPASPPAAAT